MSTNDEYKPPQVKHISASEECPICSTELDEYFEESWTGEYQNIFTVRHWFACRRCEVTFAPDELFYPEED